MSTSVVVCIWGAGTGELGAEAQEALTLTRELAAGLGAEIKLASLGAISAEAAAGAVAFGAASVDSIGLEAARLAGQLWQEKRKRGAKRDRVVPDFLIGAHAQYQADALLSRDRGFYKSYFKDLPTIDPTRL